MLIIIKHTRIIPFPCSTLPALYVLHKTRSSLFRYPCLHLFLCSKLGSHPMHSLVDSTPLLLIQIFSILLPYWILPLSEELHKCSLLLLLSNLEEGSIACIYLPQKLSSKIQKDSILFNDALTYFLNKIFLRVFSGTHFSY